MTDGAHAAVAHRCAPLHHPLGSAQLAGVGELARRHGVTQQDVLLAGFDAMLGRGPDGRAGASRGDEAFEALVTCVTAGRPEVVAELEIAVPGTDRRGPDARRRIALRVSCDEAALVPPEVEMAVTVGPAHLAFRYADEVCGEAAVRSLVGSYDAFLHAATHGSRHTAVRNPATRGTRYGAETVAGFGDRLVALWSANLGLLPAEP